jgi:hypothetical protein
MWTCRRCSDDSACYGAAGGGNRAAWRRSNTSAGRAMLRRCVLCCDWSGSAEIQVNTLESLRLRDIQIEIGGNIALQEGIGRD